MKLVRVIRKADVDTLQDIEKDLSALWFLRDFLVSARTALLFWRKPEDKKSVLEFFDYIKRIPKREARSTEVKKLIEDVITTFSKLIDDNRDHRKDSELLKKFSVMAEKLNNQKEQKKKELNRETK